MHNWNYLNRWDKIHQTLDRTRQVNDTEIHEINFKVNYWCSGGFSTGNWIYAEKYAESMAAFGRWEKSEMTNEWIIISLT